MGQNPNLVPPVNIPIPTKIGSKMGGEFTYQPKWDPISFHVKSGVHLFPNFASLLQEPVFFVTGTLGPACVRSGKIWGNKNGLAEAGTDLETGKTTFTGSSTVAIFEVIEVTAGLGVLSVQSGPSVARSASPQRRSAGE